MKRARFGKARSAMLIFFVLLSLPVSSALAKDKTVRVSTSYKTLLSTPEQTGMLDQIIIEAFRRIGVKAEVVFTPTERSLVQVNYGELDCELNRTEGMEQLFPNLCRVPEPNMVMHFVAFAKKPFPISGWDSLRELRVGYVSGWKILEHNTNGFPNVTHVLTPEQLFQMLEMDRIDVALYAKLTGYERIKALGYDNIRHLDPPLASKSMFLYLNKKHKDLAAPLAKALKDMKYDGTYERIVRDTTAHLR